MSPRRVTLLTDFGTVDGYAAAMAGVIAAGAPEAVVDHASHDVPQGDLYAASFTLARYAFLYPAGTVHVVVVDPGVGTERRPIAAQIAGRVFVAPDNGVLTRVLPGARTGTGSVSGAGFRVVEITDRSLVKTASATFHGRDIFAPAAAHCARGHPLEELGPAVLHPVRLQLPQAERRQEVGTVEIVGEVVQVDRYGNLITNIPEDWLHPPTQGTAPRSPTGGAGATGSASARPSLAPRPAGAAGGTGGADTPSASPPMRIQVGGKGVGPLRRTYADVGEGELVALIGSVGVLEVSVRNGSAAAHLAVDRGAPVTVRL